MADCLSRARWKPSDQVCEYGTWILGSNAFTESVTTPLFGYTGVDGKLGAPSRAHLRKIYTIAAVIAGIAGALLAQTTETVSLETLGFQRSADVLVILILGGAGRLYGGLVGAIIFMVARDQFSGNTPQFWYFWIGILLVTVVMFLPNGILGGLAKLTSRWSKAS